MKAALSLLVGSMLAACTAEPDPLVTVSDARVIALPSSAGVYFTLANSGGRDRLLSVDAGAAGTASLHETSMAGDMMRMRAITGGMEIPEHGQVRLSPSGKHVMIQGLTRPLPRGSSLRLTLHFERQDDLVIAAPVGGPR